MAGSAINVQSRLWAEADVLIYLTPVAELPTTDLPATITDPFDTAEGKWGFLGMLVGDSGMEQNRTWDETKIPAWGYGVVAAPVKNFELETKVSALEDNAVMQSILWPGSTETSIVVPKPLHAYFALEKRTALGAKHRAISVAPAKIWVPTIKDAEGDAPPLEVTFTVFPNSGMELYKVQKSAA